MTMGFQMFACGLLGVTQDVHICCLYVQAYRNSAISLVLPLISSYFASKETNFLVIL